MLCEYSKETHNLLLKLVHRKPELKKVGEVLAYFLKFV